MRKEKKKKENPNLIDYFSLFVNMLISTLRINSENKKSL